MASKQSKTITVTKDNIECAVPENSAMCMIAEAIKTSIPGSKKPHVDMQTIRYTDAKGVRRTYLTPGRAQVALVAFDAGDDVKPFSFSLHVPVHIAPPPTAQKRITVAVSDDEGRHAKVTKTGGRSLPTLRQSTRRRFGIRGLRINQEGKVVQAVADDR